MSVDLVKRARDCANGRGCTKTDRGDLGIFDDLADRIEELEAENKRLTAALATARADALREAAAHIKKTQTGAGSGDWIKGNNSAVTACFHAILGLIEQEK